VTFSYTIVGGVPPYVVTISSGALPTGLTMDTDGDVTGTFSAAGTYNWVVQVVDGDGEVATHPDSATVLDYWSSIDRINDATGSMVLTNSSRDAEAVAILGAPPRDLGVRATLGRTTGRYYVEFEVLADNVAFLGFVGLAQAGFNLATDAFNKPETVGHDFQDRPSSGMVSSATGPNTTTGSILGVAVDLDARHAWVHIDGTYSFGQTPVTDPNGGVIGATMPAGMMYPVFTAQDTTAATSNKVRLRYLTAQMTHKPATFTAWGE